MGLGVVVVVGWGGGGGQAQQLRSAGTRRQRSTAAHRDAIPTPLTKTHPHRHPQLVSAHDLSSEACLPRVCASSPPLPSPLTGNIECVSCAIGFYGNVPGLGCFPAPAGTFVNTTGAYTPTPWCAPAGTVAGGGAGWLAAWPGGCAGCAGGRVHRARSLSVNVQSVPAFCRTLHCLVRTAPQVPAAPRRRRPPPPPPPPPPRIPPRIPSSCNWPPFRLCSPRGSWNNEEGADNCNPCGPGKYANTLGSKECKVRAAVKARAAGARPTPRLGNHAHSSSCSSRMHARNCQQHLGSRGVLRCSAGGPRPGRLDDIALQHAHMPGSRCSPSHSTAIPSIHSPPSCSPAPRAPTPAPSRPCAWTARQGSSPHLAPPHAAPGEPARPLFLERQQAAGLCPHATRVWGSKQLGCAPTGQGLCASPPASSL